MILSVVTAESQSSLPAAVREALGLKEGDNLAYYIEGGSIRLVKADAVPTDGMFNPFALFTEWMDDLDSVYDDL